MMLPTREYKGDKNSAADQVHPDFRTRKQHLAIIGAKKRLQGEAEATRYWLSHCPRISKKAYQAA